MADGLDEGSLLGAELGLSCGESEGAELGCDDGCELCEQIDELVLYVYTISKMCA